MAMKVLGIDEAGKGPVLGPMVISGVMIEEGSIAALHALGVKDSKLLSVAQREKLYQQIVTMGLKHKTIVVSAKEIDNRDEYGLNLNDLEAVKTAEIVNALQPDKVIVDCPSPNTTAYAARIRRELEDKEVVIVAEHKADYTYPIVAAASILAKVTRDAEVERLKKKIGVDFGSGYASDERTRNFLEKHHRLAEKHPELVRKSWDTYKQVIVRKQQTSLMNFTKGSVHEEDDLRQSVRVFTDKTPKDLQHLKGFVEEKVKSVHEWKRLNGACTVILYKSGKLVIQGREHVVERVAAVVA